MSPNKILLFSAMLITVISSNACSRKSYPREELIGVPYQDTHSCDFKVGQGDAAKMNRLTEKTLSKASFGKEYNSSLLDGILTASINSSLEFMGKTGLALYKAGSLKTVDCNRVLFGSLSPMPSDIAAKFEASEKQANLAQGVVLGMYFPKDEQGLSGLASTINKPALIVRNNTNRWTLVHEFMHHLFKSRSLEKGVDSLVLVKKMSELTERAEEVRSDQKTTDLQKTEKLTPLFTKYAQLVQQIALAYPLEEVAIEVLLKERYQKGLFKFAPLNSEVYIINNLRKANELISAAMEFGMDIMENAMSQNKSDVVDQLMASENMLVELANKVEKMQEKYKDSEIKSKDNFVGLSMGDQLPRKEAHSACSEDHVIDSILDNANRLRNLKL